MPLALCWNSRLADGDVFGFATAGKPDCYKIQLCGEESAGYFCTNAAKPRFAPFGRMSLR
jgi:hypothetical protein